MAGTHTYDAIKGFLQDRLDGAYGVIDMDEIDVELEQSGDPFLALEELVGQEDTIGFGDPENVCVRESGTMIVHCYSPSPHASDATRRIGDQVRSLLRFQNFNGVRITNVGSPDPSDLMNSGLWAAAAVLIAYEWNMHVAYPA